MKKFISVIAEHDVTGEIKPLNINWDGRILSIDKIFDIRPAASLKNGGQGIRYKCRICNKDVFLFNDNGIWFIDI